MKEVERDIAYIEDQKCWGEVKKKSTSIHPQYTFNQNTQLLHNY